MRFLWAALLLCYVALPGYADQGVDAGKAAAANVKQYTGSPDAIKNNLASPALSGSPMTSFHGTQFQTRTIGCQTSVNFLQMSIATLPTGDITSLNVGQDTNLDGNLDYGYQPGIPIAGVCANGVITCSPGTWDSCSYYKWIATSTGDVSLDPTTTENLGGCYCVNNHCSNNYVASNLSKVLTDLGGGVVGAILQQNPNYTVGKASSLGSFIQYTAYKTSDCRSGDSNLSRYKSNPDQMVGDALIASSSNNMYRVLQSTDSGRNAINNTRTCSIARTVPMSEQLTDEYFSVKVGNMDYTELTVEFDLRNGTFTAVSPTQGDPSTVVAQLPPTTLYDEICTVNSNVTFEGSVDWTNPPLTFSDQAHWVSYQVLDQPTCANGLKGKVYLQDIHGVWFNTFKILAAEFKFKAKKLDCNMGADTFADNCAAIASNHDCTLVEETVDSTRTVTNSVSTQAVVPPQMIESRSDHCSQWVQRDWIQKNRSYQCRTASTFNFDEALQRSDKIQTTVTPTGFQTLQRDQQGNLNPSPMSWNKPQDTVPVAECPIVCKTKKPRLSTAVTDTAPVTNIRTDPTTYDVDYHECTDNVCPTEQGETVITPCGCVNDFPDAAVALQALRYASKDMICSDGSPH